MKKFWSKSVILLVVFAIMFPLLTVVFSVPEKQEAVTAYENVVVSEQSGEIKGISGDFVGTKVLSSDDALNFLNEFKNDFKFENAKDQLRFIKTVKSVTGTVYCFDQILDGKKVYGGEINVGVNSQGRVLSVNGKYKTDFSYDNSVNYTNEQVLSMLKEEYEGATIEFIEDQIYISAREAFVTYVYNIVYQTRNFKAYISARTGVKVHEVALNSSARAELPTEDDGYTITQQQSTQTDYYGDQVSLPVEKYLNNSTQSYYFVLADSSKNIFMTDANNLSGNNAYNNSEYYISTYPDATINDPEAVSAFKNLITCYDFYADSNNFGVTFNGITNGNGQKVKLIALVNYGVNYANAGYFIANSKADTTAYFLFGNGDGINSNSFTIGLDIVAHEYQHAITESVKALEYSGESGGLNEAYSDIFGAVIEGKAINSSGFWRMGEDIITADGYFYRDMSNPKNSYALTNGNTYECVNNYDEALSLISSLGSTDNGGVHYTSTLMTYATYLMYKNNPTEFTEEVILKLWYQTLAQYLTETATFLDFCSGMMNSANDLGYSQEVKNSIEFAFASIGVPGYDTIKTWNGNKLTMLQGEGTIAAPYLVNSVGDLASVAYYVNEGVEGYADARYRLTTDLNLSNVKWESIGTNTNPFNGYFNGGQHTISGLNISADSGELFSGLFGYVESDGYIYDLFIGSGSSNSQATYTGAIVGYNKGSISGCSSDLDITGKTVGGLAGITFSNIDEQKISNSFVTADLSGDIVGGLTAVFNTYTNDNFSYPVSGYISSCYTTGSLTGRVVGGLIGKANGVYVVNNMTTATLKEKQNGAILGGAVGELYFHDFVTNKTAVQNVMNYILAFKSTADFNFSGEQTTAGLLVGQIKGEFSQGRIYLNKNTLKTRLNADKQIQVYNLQSENISILEQNTVLSNDDLYSGVFSFDSEQLYQNNDNWVNLSSSEAFDLGTTFEVNSKNMPTFKELEFWTSLRINIAFDGGDGSFANPYRIKTAEHLTLLSMLLSDPDFYDDYATKHYILTEDIDLAGRVWVGIGYTQIYVNENTGESDIEYYPFKGTFNGNGKTISNMVTLGLYSVNALSTDGKEYYLYEFLPGLFGVTSIYANSSTSFEIPTIKNLTLEKPVSRGNYAAGVVSRAYYAINLDNVTVMDATIQSSGIAGGLVGKIEGTYSGLSSQYLKSSIYGCYVLGNISGQVVGGAVGYVTNASALANSSLDVINFLWRGAINVIGVDKQSAYTQADGYSYYQAIGGSIVGITLIKQLNIINSISLGDIVTYTLNAYVGGFIGCVGVGDILTQNKIYVVIDSSKFMGNSYYVFDNVLSSDAQAIGAVHTLSGKNIVIDINEKTVSNQQTDVIKYQNSIGLTLNNQIVTSTDQVGQEGDFDIYSNSYFKNSDNFNSSYYWTSSQIERIMFKAEFVYKNSDGKEILIGDSISGLKQGDIVYLPDDLDVPIKESTVQYYYTFDGKWSEEFLTDDQGRKYIIVSKTLKIYAQYTEHLRSYKVDYIDPTGNIIATKSIEYGKVIDQEVEAPERESNFFFEYTFLRWGEEGQIVQGETKVNAVYSYGLTTKGMAVLFFGSFLILAVVVIIVSRRKLKN